MKLPIVTALFLSLCGVSADYLNGWWEFETAENYVQFPDSVEPRLDNEWEIYRVDSYPLPVLRAFQVFPEDDRLNIWSLLKGMNTRLHPVMWPRVQYYLQDGYEFGCRTYDEETNSDVPVTTAHCSRHCIHKGRYCAPQIAADLPDGREGHDVVKEVVRRLCMDTIMHAKDPRFIAYLEEFDNQQCFSQEHARACSIDAMTTVGIHFSAIKDCLQEEETDQDVPHAILDRNMRHLDKPQLGNFTMKDLPFVTIDGEVMKNKVLSVEHIFQQYCRAFPSDLQRPLACHACSACNDVRTCLWALTCDGTPFDPSHIDEAVLMHTAPPEVLHSKPNLDEDKKDDATTSTAGGDLHAKPDAVDNQKHKEQVVTTTTAAESENKKSEKSGAGGTIFLGIFMLLAAVVGGLFYWRHLRNKDAVHSKNKALDQLTSELSGRSTEDEDDVDEEKDDYRVRAEELLHDVALGKYGVYGGNKLTGMRPQDPKEIC